ncbi:MAG: histidine--tRNA ligase [bacterium]|nr:histidine--tRNA ligase [bacterium]
MTKLQAVNGFKDILPEQIHLWQRLEACATEVCRRFGMREIRTPILEKTELFVRSIGEATDVVEKEMYTFPDKGITMRPEATASIMRAFIEHGMHVQQPVQRLYTMGAMFRHERPQKGRLRQFHQFDAEIIGPVEPQVDAELIALGQMLFDELGLDVSLELNSLGCPVCRPPFRQKLIERLEKVQDQLCSDCRRRLHTNPLRVLDCKKPECRALVADAPSMQESLCPDCDRHFTAVRATLDSLGLRYNLNRFMVRGLDYYTRTTFEFITNQLGAQAAVGGGGRYDGLIEELGGPAVSGIGFAMGMERIVLLMEQQEQAEVAAAGRMDVYLAALGPEALAHCTVLAQLLRKRGLRVAIDYSDRSLKAQMKIAGRVQARYTLILGAQEWEQKAAILRDMETQEQKPFSLIGNTEEQCEGLVEILHDSNSM